MAALDPGTPVSNGITATTANKDIGATLPDITTFDWADTRTETQYTWLQDSDLDLGAQVLLGLGGLSVGLIAEYVQDQRFLNAAGSVDLWVAANKIETFTQNYDTAIATAEPAATLDYTETSSWSAPDSFSEIGIGIPLAVQFGSEALAATVSASFANYDGSGPSSFAPALPNTRVYTDPADAATTLTSIEANTTTSTTSSTSIDLDATVNLPGLVGSHQDNRLTVGVSGGIDLYNGTSSEVYTSQERTYAGAGAAATVGVRDNDTIAETLMGKSPLAARLSVQHFWYFDVGPVTFSFAPMLAAEMDSRTGISIAGGNALYPTTQVTIDRVDGDTDGAFTSATVDTVATTTVTYANNDDGDPTDYILTFDLPSAVKVQPENWPFGMTFGGNLAVSLPSTEVKDVQDRTTTEINTVDGAGTSLGIDTTNAAEGYETSSVTKAWSFINDFQFGINIPLPLDAVLDIVLNFSNLLSFDNLTAQIVMPLP